MLSLFSPDVNIATVFLILFLDFHFIDICIYIYIKWVSRSYGALWPDLAFAPLNTKYHHHRHHQSPIPWWKLDPGQNVGNRILFFRMCVLNLQVPVYILYIKLFVLGHCWPSYILLQMKRFQCGASGFQDMSTSGFCFHRLMLLKHKKLRL